MNFLDLVRPSAKDIGSGQRIVRRYVETMTANAASAALTATSTVCPPDTIRIIHTVCFITVAGAAQTNLWCSLVHNEGGGGANITQTGMQFDLAPAAAGTSEKTLTGLEIAVMQSEVLIATANFNGGVAANVMTCYVTGWEFPRGNLQR